MDETLRVLERLAITLGVPVEAFFEGHAGATTSAAASAHEIEAVIGAFRAIGDPVMRRYCLDVIRAAGAVAPPEPPRA